MELPLFGLLRPHFPGASVTPAEVAETIGGKVLLNYKNDPDYKNTCAIRLSRALNYAGEKHRIPGPAEAANYGIKVNSGDDRRWYVFRVNDLVRFLGARYGPPVDIPRPAVGSWESAITGKRGIIHFRVIGWSDAAGHLDLWDSDACLGKAYFNPSTGVCDAVRLWEC